MKKQTETTATFLVLQALTRADDFRTVAQLIVESGSTLNRVHAALHHLHKHRVVNFIDSDSKTWWYATPEDDTRSKTVDERVMESKPRRARRPRSKKVTP